MKTIIKFFHINSIIIAKISIISIRRSNIEKVFIDIFDI